MDSKQLQGPINPNFNFQPSPQFMQNNINYNNQYVSVYKT